MRRCKQCNKELSGKKQYCNDACRMAYGRKANKKPEQTQPEQVIPNTAPAILEHYQANPDMYVERARPELLNWGPRMNMNELNIAGKKANRVPIPGDWDYEGVGK